MVAPDRAGRVRSRVIKGVVALTLAGVVYVAVVTAGRDRIRVSQSGDAAEDVRRAIQAALVETGRLPLKLPTKRADGTNLAADSITYLSTGEIRLLRDADHPVIVAYSRRIATVLLTPGRWAVMCEADRCYTEWLTGAQFAERKISQDTWIKDHEKRLIERGAKLP